ncbi:helix-turn-helix domain-containing protein [Psychrosphaera sp. 1_MG-2023]|uniref:helix-turn-helix domain-containing protein n=1 Tax=Psychrosphaera sp. 1_MG-2023 TaxID=3062643 RepID=UPI0026E482EF|nr:helix-turn-helix domain-containing protein [Psychrosphaera sp. 1_MG-2023]MDO6718835.1 helix-turn-helix domain-containing protein [Psychrosphaera sp. 1_MG-2023]
MSRKANDWAWGLNIKPASLKLLLLALADRADEIHNCFPSIQRLVKDTSLNAKTVQSGLAELSKRGLINDTSERKGPTRRVKVWRLNIQSNDPKNGNNTKIGNVTENGTISSKANDPEIGNVPKNGKITENGILNDPNFGTLNDPENGILNDPENGIQNQSLEPTIEPPIEPKAKPNKFVLPNWVDKNLWKDFLEHRKKLRKPMTNRAQELIISDLEKLTEKGYCATKLVEYSIKLGWQGIFEPQNQDRQSCLVSDFQPVAETHFDPNMEF